MLNGNNLPPLQQQHTISFSFYFLILKGNKCVLPYKEKVTSFLSHYKFFNYYNTNFFMATITYYTIFSFSK